MNATNVRWGRTAGFCAVVMMAAAGDGAEARRRLAAVRTDTPPAIDGKLDETCWRQAGRAAGFSMFAKPAQAHPEQTIGRVCLDDDNLYISLECRVAEMPKFRARLDEAAGAFEYDKAGVVEVFLDTNHDRRTFQQYLLHANGSSLITLSEGDVLAILNEDYLRSAAQVTADGFTIETAFPLAMLHLGPDTGSVWGLNLNRAHDLYDEKYDKDLFFSSWSSTEGAGFQTPERFGELAVAADLSRFYWTVGLAHEPQVGDDDVRIRVRNQTGRDFDGSIALVVARDGEPSAEHARPLSLRDGAERVIAFRHSVAAKDAAAKYKVAITDDRRGTVYLGGVQTRDLTPGDTWRPPTPTAAQQQAGYIAFRRPYTHSVLHRAVPKVSEVAGSLSVRACPGEFEPVTVALYPLRHVRNLAVSVRDLVGPRNSVIPAAAVDVRRVAWQSVWDNPRTFKAAEHVLRRFTALDLAPARTQRLWLTVRVPAGARPGLYRGEVVLMAEGHTTRLPLSLIVLPFELLRPEGMGYFMYYPGRVHESFRNPAFFAKTVQDMVDHGMTTFTVYNWVKVKDPDTGTFRLDLDTHVSGEYGVSYAQMMDTLIAAGLGRAAPLMDVFSMHYDPQFIVEMDRTCRARGWPDVLFYICDEIEYPERIAKAREILTGVRELSPEIRTTTALGPKGAAALGHMYDVWIGCSTPEMVDKCLSLGKQPWTYSCRAIYEVSTAYERYFFGRYAWKLGLKGVGLWSYAEDKAFYDRCGRQHGYSAGMVFRPEWRHRYGHVYFEGDEILPVVTWEGVREGIDDYRYMLTLKKLATAAVAGDDAGAVAAGRAGLSLIDAIVGRTDLTPAQNDHSGSKYLLDPVCVGDMDAERARIVEAILKLRRTGSGQD